jgi:hypothetical protein
MIAVGGATLNMAEEEVSQAFHFRSRCHRRARLHPSTKLSTPGRVV